MCCNTIKLLVAFAVALAVPFEPALGQQDTSATAHKHGIGKGAKMAQFAIESLSRSAGVNIMAGYYVTRNIALRLDYNPFVYIRTETFTNSYDDSTYSDLRSENKDNQHTISFSAYFMKYPTLKERVSFFWGIGPRLSLGYNLSESESFNNFTGRIDYRGDRRTDWGLGLSGIFGVEWFPKDWVGLFCDYGILLRYSWNERISLHSTNDPQSRDSREEWHSDGLYFSDRGILVGVRAYF